MKICSKCGFDYPEPLENFFSKKKNTVDGLQYSCKKCHKEYIKQHYVDNINYYKNKASESNKRRRPQILQFVIDYLKTHPCIDCGEKDPIVLEFDHVRGEKSKEISLMIRAGSSVDNIEKEIAKCDVRCANCHRRKTAKDFEWYKGISL